jgi:hypothetical protein
VLLFPYFQRSFAFFARPFYQRECKSKRGIFLTKFFDVGLSTNSKKGFENQFLAEELPLSFFERTAKIRGYSSTHQRSSIIYQLFEERPPFFNSGSQR